MTDYNILVGTGDWYKVTDGDMIVAKFRSLDDADQWLGLKLAEEEADEEWRRGRDSND